MDKFQEIKNHASSLGLTHTKKELERLIHEAEQKQSSYVSFIGDVLGSEISYRQDRAKDKRIKEAGFPYKKYLKDFDLNFCQSITPKQLSQLTELTWVDGIYNLILSGPPGVGKTHLAIALAYHACEEGYKVSYTSCKRQVLFHKFRQLIFHKKRQLFFHTHLVFDTHGLLRGLFF